MTEKTLSFKIDESKAVAIKKRALDKDMTLKELMNHLISKELEEGI